MRILSLLLAILSLALARADELLSRANHDFEEGRFKEAAEGYESLLARDGPRVAVLQNLGSAYFRLGDDGRAILAFERALLLKPRDPDLQANLKLARDQAAVFPAQQPGPWERFTGFATRRQWSQLALAMAVLAPLAMVFRLLNRSPRRRGTVLVIGVWILCLGVVGLCYVVLRQRQGEDRRAIVLTDHAAVRLSPFEKSGTRGSLEAGQAVKLGERKDGFRWVSTEDGAMEGWLAAGEVEAVVPEG